MRPDVHPGQGHEQSENRSKRAESPVDEQQAHRDGRCHRRVVGGEGRVRAAVHENQCVRVDRERSRGTDGSDDRLVHRHRQQHASASHKGSDEKQEGLPTGPERPAHEEQTKQHDAVVGEQPGRAVQPGRVAGQVVDPAEKGVAHASDGR